jgi:hypothetical protein
MRKQCRRRRDSISAASADAALAAGRHAHHPTPGAEDQRPRQVYQREETEYVTTIHDGSCMACVL